MTNSLFFSQGFRPFFLLAAVWAGAAVPLWLLAYTGRIRISAAYGDVGWHAHELIFGYAAAVLCGFLLTAIPNWTGRPPVRGRPVLALALVWTAGRAAMLSADAIGLLATAVADAMFLTALLAVALREIVAGKNWRNLRVLVIVGTLLAGNLLFHISALRGEPADLALRLSVAALIALIILVGGRITPSFTRNWLAKRKATRFPAPFGRFDAAAIASGVLALASWVAVPDAAVTAGLAAIAAIMLGVRLARWRGQASWREPLLVILHLGFGFVPLGFALLAAAALRPDIVLPSAAVHAWTAGAIGVMTVAVMTRATLGHTGRDLTATPGTVAIHAAVMGGAVLRVAAPFAPSLYLPLVTVAGLMWSIGFLAFALLYGPILASARPPRAQLQE